MENRTCPHGFDRSRLRRLAAGGTAALLLALLALQPQRCAAACAEGIALWAKVVLPALFPFLVLTALLTKTGLAEGLGRKLAPLLRPLGLPAAGAGAFVLSILSGYPVGSRVVADLHKHGAIDARETERLSALCSTSGPMFILGSVGSGMFGDARAGAILFAAHLLGIFSVYFALLPLQKRRTAKRAAKGGRRRAASAAPPSARADNTVSLGESVQGAVLSVLCVGGFIAIAGVLIRLLEDLSLLRLPTALLALCLRPFGAEECAAGAVYAVLEATRGCAALSAAGTQALPFAAFAITFGGACILAQQLTFLAPAGIRAGRFVGIKAIQGAASFLFCLLLCRLF